MASMKNKEKKLKKLLHWW